jgi:hypothetical protein
VAQELAPPDLIYERPRGPAVLPPALAEALAPTDAFRALARLDERLAESLTATRKAIAAAQGADAEDVRAAREAATKGINIPAATAEKKAAAAEQARPQHRALEQAREGAAVAALEAGRDLCPEIVERLLAEAAYLARLARDGARRLAPWAGAQGEVSPISAALARVEAEVAVEQERVAERERVAAREREIAEQDERRAAAFSGKPAA